MGTVLGLFDSYPGEMPATCPIGAFYDALGALDTARSAPTLDCMGKHSAQDSFPVWRRVFKTPELRGGGFEAEANFCYAAMLLTQVHDSAVLFLAVGDIP